MTGDKALTIGGVAAHRWLDRERGRLATRLVAMLITEVRAYRELPPAELAADIETVVAENLHALAEVLRTRQVSAPADVVLRSALRGAEEGMPPDALLNAYQLAFTETWRALVAPAGPADLPDVLACTDLILGCLSRVTDLVASVYFEERRRLSGENQDARYLLTSALLGGEPAEALAARADLTLAPRYAVVCLAVPDEDGGDSLAARRRLHRMQRELLEQDLALLDGGGGTILTPWPLRADLLARLDAACRVPVTAAVTDALVAELPERVRQAREILDVVRWFGRGPGVYRLADVLVEYQLTRPTAATGALAALLDPLDEHPGLLTTLEIHLALGRARRSTAAALHLHPNTVDYRLRKAARLTGLDPADDTDLQRLGAALAARRATTAAP